MIQFMTGNVFDQPGDIRVNTVNCVGVMGKGIALEFKKRYPKMFRDYRRACQRNEIRPGSMYLWATDTGTLIINFPTKDHWKQQSQYSYIRDGLNDLRQILTAYRGRRVVIPALGCGNGGLKWDEVRSMIQNSLSDLEDIEVFVFAPSVS